MKRNKNTDAETIGEKDLKKTAGGSLRDQYCNVRCKHCGTVVTMPKDSYLGSSSTYTGHHLCTGCGRDVYGSPIV